MRKPTQLESYRIDGETVFRHAKNAHHYGAETWNDKELIACLTVTVAIEDKETRDFCMNLIAQLNVIKSQADELRKRHGIMHASLVDIQDQLVKKRDGG